MTNEPGVRVKGEVGHPADVGVAIDALHESTTVFTNEHHLHAGV